MKAAILENKGVLTYSPDVPAPTGLVIVVALEKVAATDRPVKAISKIPARARAMSLNMTISIHNDARESTLVNCASFVK